MASDASMKIISSEVNGPVWRDIESSLDRILFEPTWGTDIPSLVMLYTAVHDHCTSEQDSGPSASTSRGAALLGGDLYRSLVVYLQQYLLKLKRHLGSFSGQWLLTRYFEESAHYINVAHTLEHVFRYLNRHWIKREIEEGRRSIYDIYTLHLVLWHSELFDGMHEELTDALSDLVETYRRKDDREVGGSGRIQLLVESIVSVQPDHAELPSSVREFYRSLLETPWRVAIQACDTGDSPAFLYERPVAAILQMEEQTCAHLEDLITSLTLNTVSKQVNGCGGRNGGTVTLVTQDETIEVDQRAAECSVLIKRLCAHFGPDIIARESIPIPKLSGPLLRKVLAWCEYHKTDANIQSASTSTSTTDSALRTRVDEVDPWDQEYFNTDAEMLFQIILAANYLDIPPLLDTGCKMVANMIKGRSPEEIRSTFNITNAFTPEEEEQIRRENEWAEDR